MIEKRINFSDIFNGVPGTSVNSRTSDNGICPRAYVGCRGTRSIYIFRENCEDDYENCSFFEGGGLHLK